MLILYPVTLLNSFICSSSFQVESLGFFIYSIISSEYNDNFTISLPVYISFISLSCLFAVTRTSSAMLSRSGKNGHLCLALDCSRNVSSFSPFSIILTMGFFIAFIILWYIPFILILVKVFIMNVCWIFSSAFFAFIGMIKWVLSFLMSCITLIYLHKLKHHVNLEWIPFDYDIWFFLLLLDLVC